MHSNLLTNSRNNSAARTIQFQQIQEIKKCKLTLQNERLYLIDAGGKLFCLNLKDQSHSTLEGHKLQYFHPDSHSSLSLTAISPSSQILHILFQKKQVHKVLNPCLNSLISFQKNYLTQTVLLLEPKLLVLVDNNKKLKSLKAKGNQLFVSACLLGINSYISVLLRSGEVQIYQTSTLKLLDSITLPFGGNSMKVAATNKGKNIAIYGNNCWLFLLNCDGKLTCKIAQLPFSSVLDLQFSYGEQIVLLGSDRILYGVHFGTEVSLKPLFNEENTFIPTAFDISLDQRLIAITAGKNVHLLDVKEGVKKKIGYAENGKIIDFSQHTSFSRVLQVNNQTQNSKPIEPKLKELKKYALKLEQYKPDQKYLNFSQQDLKFQVDSQIDSLFTWDKGLSTQNKKTTIKIYQWLSKHSEFSDFLRPFTEKTVKFISRLFQISNNPQICASLSFQLLAKIKDISNRNALQNLAVFVAPRLLQNFQERNISINQFAMELILGLFQDYVPLQNSLQLLNLLITNLKQQGFCATFFVALIQRIQQSLNSSKNKRQISAKSLQIQVIQILKQPQYSYLYVKPVALHQEKKDVEKQFQGENLQILIQRQQRIKNALKTIRSTIE